MIQGHIAVLHELFGNLPGDVLADGLKETVVVPHGEFASIAGTEEAQLPLLNRCSAVRAHANAGSLRQR